jgi:hypothetical protein
MAVYLSVKNMRYELDPIKGKAEIRTLNSELTRVKNLQKFWSILMKICRKMAGLLSATNMKYELDPIKRKAENRTLSPN